jgi:hypothetical protein
MALFSGATASATILPTDAADGTSVRRYVRLAVMSHNRRAGSRFPVGQFVVDWGPQVPKKRFSRRPANETATVLELSVTGALMRAKSNLRIEHGSHVAIGTSVGRGVVAVQRIEPDDIDHWLFGVSFVALDEPLRELIYDTVAGDRPDDLESRWRRAP